MIRLFSLILGLCFSAGALQAACAPDRVSLRGDFGAASFRVEIADDAAERAQGLMHRKTLSASRGMLFVYPAPHRAGFWMRNTLITLDILFFDSTGRLLKIGHEAQPLDETIIDGGAGVQFVLEIAGGLARAIGIAPGAVLQHPAIDPAVAAWPCD